MAKTIVRREKRKRKNRNETFLFSILSIVVITLIFIFTLNKYYIDSKVLIQTEFISVLIILYSFIYFSFAQNLSYI